MIELGDEEKTYDVEVTVLVKGTVRLSVQATSDGHAEVLAEQALRQDIANGSPITVGLGARAVKIDSPRSDIDTRGIKARSSGTVQG